MTAFSQGRADSTPKSLPTPGFPLPHAMLIRQRTDARGTFGTLAYAHTRLVTGESPWFGNQYGISCIPPGTYRCLPIESENWGRHFEVLGVPQRSEVLIHAGNWCGDEAKGLRSDVRGCILLGFAIADLAGQVAVTESQAALSRLLSEAPMGLTLDVVDATPEGRAGFGWKP